jgi:hypothetical protein
MREYLRTLITEEHPAKLIDRLKGNLTDEEQAYSAVISGRDL